MGFICLLKALRGGAILQRHVNYLSCLNNLGKCIQLNLLGEMNTSCFHSVLSNSCDSQSPDRQVQSFLWREAKEEGLLEVCGNCVLRLTPPNTHAFLNK